jgi:DNA polymerase III subunit beta
VRLSVLQENLAKGISVVGRAVSSRSTLPVLGNILLSTDDGRLKLAATNLEIGVSCWIGAQIEDEGSLTVPARLLAEWVNLMPNERIDLEMALRTMSVNLKCGRFVTNIKGIDANEFPLIPVADGERSLQLPSALLRKMIEQVAFAAATDDSRVALTGVQARFEGDRLTLAATDGFRLSVRKTILPEPVAEDLSVIIPARSLAEVARIAADAADEKPVDICVAIGRNQVLFRLQGMGEGEKGGYHQVDLVSQLIDAKFPDFNNILPKSFATRAVLDTAALLKAVKAASFFLPSVAKNVRLQINPGADVTPGQITLSANSAEVGDSLSEVDAVVEGGPLEIAFNAKYMIDVLSVIDTPQVVLETTHANRPGVLRPVGTGPDEFTHVIMPMQLSK